MLPAWSRHVPFLRAHHALQERLGAVESELRRTREERDAARRVNAHLVSYGKIKELIRAHAEAYQSAQPFPHVVLDGVFDAGLLDQVLAEFDAMDRASWHYTERETERKYSSEDFQHFGPVTRAVFAQFNSASFLAFLEKLTGIAGLVPDPHLRGGGLHEIRAGGKLGVHADFNFYPRLKLYRRLNLLLYLNRDWGEDWGGDLELWDRTGTQCVRRIAPLFNRTVIFDTSNFSYHGHPRLLQCPPERSRKSLALYYYTVEAPADDDQTPHTTVFIAPDRVPSP
jgi:Rps23 Pro-64 3,4-dihydroxylase Tpa1-like proline 4-hydroxylase